MATIGKSVFDFSIDLTDNAVGASPPGDAFLHSEQQILLVTNGSDDDVQVTFESFSDDVDDWVVEVPAHHTVAVGPFRGERRGGPFVNPLGGHVRFTYFPYSADIQLNLIQAKDRLR